MFGFSAPVIGAGCLLVLAVSACVPVQPGAEPAMSRSAARAGDGNSATADPTTEPPRHGVAKRRFDQPPAVTVRFGANSVDLDAHTFCYGSTCADGVPPHNPPDVGSPDYVLIDFPLDGWSFKATFEPAGAQCGQIQAVTPRPIGDRSWLLRPAGPAGVYDVTLSGRGQGDLYTTFRWATPSDGPLPTPKAWLAILSLSGAELGSYGTQLAVSNLARTPTQAAADITVTAANGKSTTFQATQIRKHFCEGSIYWGGPDMPWKAAGRLGPAPFTYKVVMTLDGQRHTATATWPADEIRGSEPSVALRFTPALPALR